jgi:hypothetical protein
VKWRIALASIPWLVLLAHATPARAESAAQCACDLAPIMGKVTSVKDGKLEVDLGTAHGIEPGMRVGVIACCDVAYHPDHVSAWVCPDSEDVKAVVELTEVGTNSSTGVIGRASAANKGDLVFVTDRAPTHKKLFPGFPQQWTNIFDLSLTLRAIPGVWSGGVGFPFEFELSYQFVAPIKLSVFSAPSFVGIDGDAVVARSILGFGTSFSTRFFEVGIGVAAHMDSMGPERQLALVQSVRLGAEDGLMLKVANTLIFEPDWRNGFHWDSVHAEIRIPIHWRVSLYVDGGGGGNASNMWWFRMTTGVHVMIRGTGGPGTVILPFGIGGGFYELSDNDCDWSSEDCVETYFASVIFVTGLQARF